LVHNSCGKTKTFVFWLGGDKTKNAARAWAEANNGITLEMTATGKWAEKITKSMPMEKSSAIRDDVSEKFALRAEGEVRVFLTSAAAKRTTRTWGRIEYPTLLVNDKVRRIIPHMIDW
jgi:hypothetical protein